MTGLVYIFAIRISFGLLVFGLICPEELLLRCESAGCSDAYRRHRWPKLLQSWQAIVANQHYKSWCGHAFEMLSWNHAGNIAHALGVARSDYSVTCATIDSIEGSAQIDLLFDVSGGAMYLFELKFSDHPYVMVAAEAKQLLSRRQVFEREYNGSRSIIVCLFTPCGAKRNPQLDSVVDLVLDEAAVFL